MTQPEKKIDPIRVRILGIAGAPWGEDTPPEAVEILAPNVLALTRVYLRSQHPGVPVDADLTEDYLGGLVTGHPYAIASQLAVYLYAHSLDAPLWKKEFNPDLFFKENPPD